MKPGSRGALGFSFLTTKNESVFIYHDSKKVTTLRGSKALSFISKLDFLSSEQQQQYMARLTGNYKHGNEKSDHEAE